MSQQEPEKGVFRLWRVFLGAAYSISAVFLSAQITACIVVLVLSKHEKPHFPLRAFIIAQLCVCALYLVLLFLDYLPQKKLLTVLADQITSESATFDNHFLSCVKFQAVSGCIKSALGCFIMAWCVAGAVWVSMASSTRSDAPRLFWTSIGIVILSFCGSGVMILSSFATCCCVPCILACADVDENL